MKKIIKKSKCCGCHSCMNACPKNAITMQEDNDGFRYPVINQDKCVDCGICKKVCPILSKKEEKKDINAYACYNKNIEERMNSSSGGIFILIAKEIIKRNGVVFGASFNEKFEVVHKYVETEDELKQLMGSKYSQSTIGNSYKKVKQFLNNDRYVLFTGTPCQIEGLKSYLIKDYDKLYTQDIICHGVPSPKVWKKYLLYQENKEKEKVKNVSFRNKDLGWSSFQMKIEFETKTYKELASKDMYMQSFLKNICLRKSCYDCSFKKKYRISDITLADYWGINKNHPEINDDKGVSLVIINSKNGEELFNTIKPNINYIKTDFEKSIKYNRSFVHSANHYSNEKKFFDSIDTMSFEESYKMYVSNNKISNKITNKVKKIYNRIFK